MVYGKLFRQLSLGRSGTLWWQIANFEAIWSNSFDSLNPIVKEEHYEDRMFGSEKARNAYLKLQKFAVGKSEDS